MVRMYKRKSLCSSSYKSFPYWSVTYTMYICKVMLTGLGIHQYVVSYCEDGNTGLSFACSMSIGSSFLQADIYSIPLFSLCLLTSAKDLNGAISSTTSSQQLWNKLSLPDLHRSKGAQVTEDSHLLNT